MSDNKKGNIGNIALKMSSSKMMNVDAGCYDYLLSIDMESIIRRFNAGDYSVLDSEEVEKFLGTDISAIELIDYILKAKSLLQYKNDFYSEVERLEDGMIYNPKDIYYTDRYSYDRGTLTYFQTDLAFRLAERFVNDTRVYGLLKFLLRYESLKSDIVTRKTLLHTMKQNPEGTEQLHRVLDQYDPNVGIVKIVEDGKVTVKVGTKHDMEISNLIGKPFLTDCDEPEYYYGGKNDWHHPAHKVTKEFYENGTTPNHKKLIEAEKQYRVRLSQSNLDEDGFIIAGNKAIIISSLELTKLGIDPKAVGWRPLKLCVNPQSLFKVCKQNESTRYLSFRTKVQLKKDIILSKKQH